MHADHPLRDGLPPKWANGYGFDEYGPFVEVYVSEATLRMRWIPPGTFMMGSPEDEVGRLEHEVQREVMISTGFWLADAPVTQALWQAVMGENPSQFKHVDRPVEQVSWHDVQGFIERLNGRARKLDARLPTEAEWEYACRAGTTTATYAGDLVLVGRNNAPVLDTIAWYGGNSGVDYDLAEGLDNADLWLETQYEFARSGTRMVRQKLPNSWGLFDMLGNVYEWCADDWTTNPADGLSSGASDGTARKVVRGGSWEYLARHCRAAWRNGDPLDNQRYYLGFRLSCGPTPGSQDVEIHQDTVAEAVVAEGSDKNTSLEPAGPSLDLAPASGLPHSAAKPAADPLQAIVQVRTTTTEILGTAVFVSPDTALTSSWTVDGIEEVHLVQAGRLRALSAKVIERSSGPNGWAALRIDSDARPHRWLEVRPTEAGAQWTMMLRSLPDGNISSLYGAISEIDVHQAALEFHGLSGTRPAYAAGGPILVEGAVAGLLTRGLPEKGFSLPRAVLVGHLPRYVHMTKERFSLALAPSELNLGDQQWLDYLVGVFSKVDYRENRSALLKSLGSSAIRELPVLPTVEGQARSDLRWLLAGPLGTSRAMSALNSALGLANEALKPLVGGALAALNQLHPGTVPEMVIVMAGADHPELDVQLGYIKAPVWVDEHPKYTIEDAGHVDGPVDVFPSDHFAAVLEIANLLFEREATTRYWQGVPSRRGLSWIRAGAAIDHGTPLLKESGATEAIGAGLVTLNVEASNIIRSTRQVGSMIRLSYAAPPVDVLPTISEAQQAAYDLDRMFRQIAHDAPDAVVYLNLAAPPALLAMAIGGMRELPDVFISAVGPSGSELVARSRCGRIEYFTEDPVEVMVAWFSENYTLAPLDADDELVRVDAEDELELEFADTFPRYLIEDAAFELATHGDWVID